MIEWVDILVEVRRMSGDAFPRAGNCPDTDKEPKQFRSMGSLDDAS